MGVLWEIGVVTKGGDFNGTGGSGGSRFCARLSSVRGRLGRCGGSFGKGVIFYGYSSPFRDGFFGCFTVGFGRLKLGGLVTAYCINSPVMDIRLSLFSIGPVSGMIGSNELPRGVRVARIPSFGRSNTVSLSSMRCLLGGRGGILALLSNSNSFHSTRYIRLLGRTSVIIAGPPFSLFERCITRLVGCSGGFVVVNNRGTVACGRVFTLFRRGGV